MSLKPSVGPNDHMQGNKNAGLVIVEFGDYQCSFCGAAFPVLKEMMRDYGDQLKFIFRNFPLSEIHAYARPAALVAESAAIQGKFWEMHDAIYQNQQYLDENLLRSLETKLELDTDQVNRDIQTEKLEVKVDNDFESGMVSGVNGTPTFFVNGRKFDGGAEDLFEMLKTKL